MLYRSHDKRNAHHTHHSSHVTYAYHSNHISPTQRGFSFLITLVAMLAVVSALFGATATPAYADPSTWYVDGTGTIGKDVSNDCLFAATPCKTISGVLKKTGVQNGDTIMVLSSTYTETAAITLDKNLTIKGAGIGATLLDGEGKHALITIAANTNVTLADMTLQNGTATQGGAILNNGTLTLSNVALSSNKATDKGGAIYNVGKLTIEQTTFTQNSATNDGGAIANVGNDAQLSLARSTLYKNTAKHGGAIANANYAFVQNTTLSGNTASEDGGAMINTGKVEIKSTTIVSNTAKRGGGWQVLLVAHHHLSMLTPTAIMTFRVPS